MTKDLIRVALFAILLMLAPLAAAETDSGNTTEGSSERPDDAAWVEDCPPDMMCAASGSGDGSTENVTRGEDCEYCRDHQDQDCLDCLGAPGADDDTTWGTDCPPEVFCMGNGEADGPDDAGWVDCDGEVCAYDQPDEEGPLRETGEASAVGAVLFGMLGLLALAVAGRRA